MIRVRCVAVACQEARGPAGLFNVNAAHFVVADNQPEGAPFVIEGQPRGQLVLEGLTAAEAAKYSVGTLYEINPTFTSAAEAPPAPAPSAPPDLKLAA